MLDFFILSGLLPFWTLTSNLPGIETKENIGNLFTSMINYPSSQKPMVYKSLCFLFVLGLLIYTFDEGIIETKSWGSFGVHDSPKSFYLSQILDCAEYKEVNRF